MQALRTNPNDRDSILRAIGFAIGYQDEPLFDTIVETLDATSSGDAAIQELLGDGYSYFARWPMAEQAYHASLAIEEKESVREQLALALLKQGRPDEAWPYLKHILENKKADSAGLIYLLIQSYQVQGRHEEALAIMDERDAAFPQWANAKEHKQQRKTSVRYQGSEKKVRSAARGESKFGYREGGWSSRLPRWIPVLLLLGATVWYFGMALFLGQSRKVFFVNGTNEAYGVVIEGKRHNLGPNSATPIPVVEGDLQVSFSDKNSSLGPIIGRVETSFWTRPFFGATFVINPDQSAIVVEEEAYYARVNPRMGEPAKVHFGKAVYAMPGVNYEFQDFPATIQVEGNSQVRRTRVGFEHDPTFDTRLNLLQGLEEQEQLALCEKVLRLDPNNVLLLNWLAGRLQGEKLVEFVEPRLHELPILVEWHRLFQTQMETVHPDTDLLPRYRKLVTDTNRHPDALYLLARIDPDLNEGDKLIEEGASADLPTGYPFYALGFRALGEARFPEAIGWFEKALPVLKNKIGATHFYQQALLANGNYDQLFEALRAEAPANKLKATVQMMRISAIRGDKAQARQTLTEVLQLLPVLNPRW